MILPFTEAQFFEVFRQYNHAVWPAQLVLLALAIAILVAVAKPGPRTDRLVAGALALLWLWTGVVYHFGFFRSINPAAPLFAGLSVAAAAVFAWQGFGRDAPHFAWRPGPRGVAAAALIAYALLIYPAIGLAAGHGGWASPSFGAPCPTTLFTFGVLLLAAPLRAAVLVAPVTWALIGTSAAIVLGVRQDLGLLVAAALAVGFLASDRLRRAER